MNCEGEEQQELSFIASGIISCIASLKDRKFLGFPGGSFGKEFACNAEDLGSIPGLGRSSGEGNGSPLQYSCLENPMDRGAWQATVHRVAQIWRQLKQLSMHA